MLGGVALILALFGGAYIAAESSSNKRASDAFDRKMASEKEAFERRSKEFERRVCDDALEQRMWVACTSTTGAYRKEMEELIESWSFYFPGVKLRYADEFLKTGDDLAYYRTLTEMVNTIGLENMQRMLLANRGKLKSMDASMFGITIKILPFVDKTEDEKRQIFATFISRINQKLRHAGIDEQMYIGGHDGEPVRPFNGFVYRENPPKYIINWEPSLSSSKRSAAGLPMP